VLPRSLRGLGWRVRRLSTSGVGVTRTSRNLLRTFDKLLCGRGEMWSGGRSAPGDSEGMEWLQGVERARD
jgi:hypothetical protein